MVSRGASHLNGTTGHLIKFDNKEQRWAVRCDDDDQVVKAKPENLKRLRESTTQEAPVQEVPGHDPGPVPDASSSHGTCDSLHECVLDSFYKRRMGGVVVSYRKSYMLAVEFDSAFGNGVVYGQMVYADKNPQTRAVVQKNSKRASAKELGRDFLMGKRVEYIEATNENAFFSLLNKYKQGSSTQIAGQV